MHIEQPSHPIVEGVSDFEIEDELSEIGGDTTRFEAFTEAFARHGWSEDVVRIGEGPLQPDVTVLASAEGNPLIYTRTFGAGRVHTTRSEMMRSDQIAPAAVARGCGSDGPAG